MALHGCMAMENLTDVERQAEARHYMELYEHFDQIYHRYRPLHGPLSAVVCVIGLLMNIANISVLTRPSMLNPINVILTGIAVSDICLNGSYLIYLTHFVLQNKNFFLQYFCDPSLNTYGWTLFQLFHVNSSMICHAISLWLAVGMACWRYVILSQPHPASVRNLSPSVVLILITVALVVMLSIPTFLSYHVISVPVEETICAPIESSEENNTQQDPMILYSLEMWSDACVVRNVSFWIAGLIFKIFPCALLSVFTSLLIATLVKVNDDCERGEGSTTLISISSIVDISRRENTDYRDCPYNEDHELIKQQ